MEKAFVLGWKAVAAAEDRHAALVEHFRYLADTPGFEPVLEAVMKAVVDVAVTSDEDEERLVLHFPGREKLYASAPDPDPSGSYPQSFRNVLSRHAYLNLENAQILLGDHGMFDEGDGWFDALEDEESDLLEFGLDTILSPMSDYSDLWLYHPSVKNAYGEPTLCYLSHEGGDIDNPQDWNIGSLFLARAARSLDLKVTLPTPAPFAGAPAPAEWWNGLSDAWKAVLRDQWGVSGPDSADKAFKKRDLYISDKFQVESLEPARILRKLQSIACESQEIRNLSPLTDLPALSSVRFTSKAITDFSPLAQCRSLTSVTLSKTTVADLSFTASLAKLETLECDDTPVSDLSPLEGLGKLKRLSFSGTKISDLRPLSSLRKLRDLDLANTPVASLEPLAGLRKLSVLDVRGTKIETLRPIQDCKEVHILHCENTVLGLDEELAYYANNKRRNDSFIGLTFCGDSINVYDPEKFLSALETTPPTTEGIETVLTVLTNDFLISFLKSKEDKPLASRLLCAYFALSIDAAPEKIREELAANAMVAVVAGLCDEQIEKLVFERLIDKGVTDSRLAFNLACWAAKRGDKVKLLEYMGLSLNKGHDRERFRADADFAAYQDDPDFATLLEAQALPDPETDPLGWWEAIPESLRRMLDPEEETEEGLRDYLRGDRFELWYDDAKSLDPLRNLRSLRKLTLRMCRALSLDAVSTLTGLESFECEKDQYLPGTRFADAAPLAPLKKLKRLDLRGHEIKDISPLAGLVELEALKLNGNPVASIKPLSALVKLQELFIACTGVVDTSDLAPLTALRDLSLKGKVLSLEGLRGMKELHYLGIQDLTPADGQPFSLEPLSGLEKLDTLFLASTPFVSLEPLFSLPSLTRLFVDRKMISPELEAVLKTNMPRCELVF